MDVIRRLPVVEVNKATLLCRDTALRQHCREVDVTNAAEMAATHQIIREMFRTLFADPSGVALAAPQVGFLLQIVVVSYHDRETESDVLLALLNPKINVISDEIEEDREVCLSVPNLSGRVSRAKAVEVSAYDQHGRPIVLKASGFLARIFQHETDHLAGVLYVDKADGDLEDVLDFPDRRLEPTMRKLKLKPSKPSEKNP